MEQTIPVERSLAEPGPVSKFWLANPDALFRQDVVALVLCCSESKLEKLRLVGGGPVFFKDGRACLYRKRDVVEHIEARRAEREAV